ncbi:hypothetical protein I7I51_08748 [Histoplasma capsulatum]|uniref:Transcriptional regulatory protein RXT2 N-terminal domain-containing protein n=1 Tax=Ajellomyces capsulatus TaxID=5037 RepID=A0A8A1M166_AJECA|nr:predicted protein [Histoplasma mississippiense (nom. inval.)]EDN04118.1 predicted protein [Histoplasma mississippiense (nom. inval.)]QSS59315.1 hypothetical protein I7I51_08748 [Histoplasma capsulatum]
MAVQAAMIADTITAMKRALERQRLGAMGVDDPITQPTNRGNKLRINAEYVHEGALGFTDGVAFYRKRINHAGYTRDIVERNPPKYDSEGDELDEEDAEEHADPEMADENPFGDIHLEELLAPLKHPSELATHPSMSHPYTSKTLQMMVDNANAKLRQEQDVLHKAKRLHRELLGDAPWMPCGFLETMDDRNIFDPNYGFNSRSSSKQRDGRGRSGRSSRGGSPENQAAQIGNNISISLPNYDPVKYAVNGVSPEQHNTDHDVEMGDTSEEPLENKDIMPPEKNVTGETIKVNGQAVFPPESTNGDTISTHIDAKKQPSIPTTNKDPLKAKEEPKDGPPVDTAATNGGDINVDKDGDRTEDEAIADDNDNDEGISSPEPPRRMTTRARANQAANQATTPTFSDIARSGTPSSSTANNPDNLNDPLTMHPIFLLPPTHLDRNCGLPPSEADEVRRMLWSYIQKQEETVRASQRMYHMLLSACRKKELVWEWCKAEGHVGELSDGEDWYDRQQWGLGDGEDLRKGADEDEVDGGGEEGRGGGGGTGTGTAKRGRGRRA